MNAVQSGVLTVCALRCFRPPTRTGGRWVPPKQYRRSRVFWFHAQVPSQRRQSGSTGRSASSAPGKGDERRSAGQRAETPRGPQNFAGRPERRSPDDNGDV